MPSNLGRQRCFGGAPPSNVSNHYRGNQGNLVGRSDSDSRKGRPRGGIVRRLSLDVVLPGLGIGIQCGLQVVRHD